MHAGFITCRDLGRYFPSNTWPGLTRDDAVLASYLAARGDRVTPVIWGTSPDSFDPSIDVLIIRSPWDYMDSSALSAAFMTWLEELDAAGRLVLNPLPLVAWNFDKHYLGDLARCGVEIIPTEYLEAATDWDRSCLEQHVATHGPSVLKPCISAAARDTFLLESPAAVRDMKARNGSGPGSNGREFRKWVDGRAFMLQPFLPAVRTEGEWSLIFLDGDFSHAVHKLPARGEWLVQDELGGSVCWETPPAAAVAAAQHAMSMLSRHIPAGGGLAPLYARVDVIMSEDRPMVGELELIEPELFFLMRDPHPAKGFTPALEKFRKGLLKRLGEGP